MLRANVAILKRVVPALETELGVELIIATHGGDDRITIDVTERVTRNPIEQPWRWQLTYSVDIDLDNVSSAFTKRVIRASILAAKNNLHGTIGRDYDPKFNESHESVEQILGHDIV